jgi:hypothetical protein
MPKKREDSLGSPLAKALARIMDGSGVYDRNQWASLCQVSASAISQWISGVTLPRPEILRTVYFTITTTDGFPDDAIAEFRRVAALPAIEATPVHASKVGVSIEVYMLGPIRELFLQSLDALPARAQERLLPKLMQQCDDFEQEEIPEADVHLAINANLPAKEEYMEKYPEDVRDRIRWRIAARPEWFSDRIERLFNLLNRRLPEDRHGTGRREEIVDRKDIRETCVRLLMAYEGRWDRDSSLVIADLMRSRPPIDSYRRLQIIDRELMPAPVQ